MLFHFYESNYTIKDSWNKSGHKTAYAKWEFKIMFVSKQEDSQLLVKLANVNTDVLKLKASPCSASKSVQ